MFKIIILLIGFVTMGTDISNVLAKESAHNFTFNTLQAEKSINLNDYKGKVILIVNTASNCGFTNQYKGLESLYNKYKDMGLIVIAVPSNDFGKQEPGSEQEIINFCEINYGVTFPMTAKYSVKGDDAHPFYQWAKKELGFGTAPKWNFHKYLINRDGELINYFHSTTTPDSPRLVKAIEAALQEK